MDFDFTLENYRAVIDHQLGHRKERRPRGAIKALATSIGCHSTHIAQVLKGNADFSPEQAFEACRHFGFSTEQQDFFLTLHARDRAGTLPLKRYHQNRLEQLLEKQRDLKPKANTELHQSDAFGSEYFGNWIYQAIHALTQIPRFQNASAIAKIVQLPLAEIRSILQRLEDVGLVRVERNVCKSTQSSLHLSKDSLVIRSLHSTWKSKILSDVQTHSMTEGTRFSGVITVSEQDFQRVRGVLANSIREIRGIVEASPPEAAYILSVDCYNVLG